MQKKAACDSSGGPICDEYEKMYDRKRASFFICFLFLLSRFPGCRTLFNFKLRRFSLAPLFIFPYEWAALPPLT